MRDAKENMINYSFHFLFPENCGWDSKKLTIFKEKFQVYKMC